MKTNEDRNKNNKTARSRVISYIVLTVTLFLGFLIARQIEWQGNKQLHTIMEVIATLLAGMVGILALIRFYTKRNNLFLFIGSGFLGTAFLDGYHGIVTSTFFDLYFPSPPVSLIPWSWVASRLFLSVLMVLSYWASLREENLGEHGLIKEKIVYLGMGIATLSSFVFFVLYPLPRAYYPEYVFGRPEEFVPAAFFLWALIGYLKKQDWKEELFEHWVILSLIVGFMSHVMFMSFSFKLFDTMFDAAHTLKKLSYICILQGLLISMYQLFKQAESGKEDIVQALKTSQLATIQAEKDKLRAEESTIRLSKVLSEAEAAKKEVEETNEMMLGREERMIAMKKEIEILRGKNGAQS